MSGNWNRTPRKGEKSINAVRSDQEHRIRIEYRDAGVIQGLVKAWSIATDWARQGCWGEPCEVDGAKEVADRIACELLDLFPKRGRMDLVNVGAETAYLDGIEERVKRERRLAREAKEAAKTLGVDFDGA